MPKEHKKYIMFCTIQIVHCFFFKYAILFKYITAYFICICDKVIIELKRND